MTGLLNFASDNNAGAHPEILEALEKANHGFAKGYGYDDLSEQARQLCASMFTRPAHLFHVGGGASANILSLEPLLDRYGAVLCSEHAHITIHEGGAPEKMLGNKLLNVSAPEGKLTIDALENAMHYFEDEFQPVPQVLSLALATEYGTLYSLDELASLSEYAKKHSLKVHIDGARISNAVVALDCSFDDIVTASGVHSMSFGMTKNGGMFGENIIIFDDGLAHNFVHLRSGSVQMYSKMRYIAAQFLAFHEGDLYRRCASTANEMAKRLLGHIKDNTQIKLSAPVETNAIFAILDQALIDSLLNKAYFYVEHPHRREIRWMTSWATTPEDIDKFASYI